MEINFNDIPPYSAPYPFWYWNGEMKKDVLTDQLAIMREKGIEEFIMHARYGLKTPYLSEEWFAAVSHTVEEAHRTGMRAWIYDELNWPSGSAGGIVTSNPDLIEHFIDSDGKIRETSFSPETSPDYLNPDTAEAFISVTHEKYFRLLGKYFGNTIPGFFNDEVRFANSRPWSKCLGGKIPEGPEYFRKTGDAITRNYFEKISLWCRKHNVRLIGHVMGEETLASNVRYMSTIFPILRQFQEPGIDHLGHSAEGMHPRIAASVSHLFGGNTPVTCETGAALPWDFTLEDLFRISGWLYASGVTRIILHGFFYEENPEDWSPDMFFRWKNWDQMGTYIMWAKRIQYFLAKAKPVRRVAIYYPLQEFLESYVPNPAFVLDFGENGPLVEGERARQLNRSVQELGSALTSAGIDYLIVPEEWLGRLNNCILIAPCDTKPVANSPILHQDTSTAEECVKRLEKMLGARTKVVGDGAHARPRAASDIIHDPYIHTSADDGGVLVREFLLGRKPSIMLWNANESEFSGTCALEKQGDIMIYDPQTDKKTYFHDTENLDIKINPYSKMILIYQ